MNKHIDEGNLLTYETALPVYLLCGHGGEMGKCLRKLEGAGGRTGREKRKRKEKNFVKGGVCRCIRKGRKNYGYHMYARGTKVGRTWRSFNY